MNVLHARKLMPEFILTFYSFHLKVVRSGLRRYGRSTTYFLLNRLRAGIRSRCSKVNFTPLSHEACRKVIETVRSQESKDSRLSTLVRLSMGRPGLAASGDLIEERAWFIKLLKGMLNAEKDGGTSKEEMERWFDFLLILFRDMAIIKIT